MAPASSDDGVEVVEVLSIADTSEDVQSTVMATPEAKRKRYEVNRYDVAHETKSQREVDGDMAAGLQTPPPKKKHRALPYAVDALEALIEVIADDDEVLSTRLEYSSNLWTVVREMKTDAVIEFVRKRSSCVVDLIRVLLHTGYFPLQQLCFMIVAAILHRLHKRDSEVLAALVVSCEQYMSEAEFSLLDLLPLRDAVPSHDPRIARQHVVQINQRTGVCQSFRTLRCWVSPNDKRELARIRVNKWVDIGTTTTTFYWRDQNDIVVVNVPHSCVEDVEIDAENCIIYIWTKHLDRLKGVRLLAFSSIPADFPAFVKALVGREIEGYDPAPELRIEVDIGSPIGNLKTTSTLVLAPSPNNSPHIANVGFEMSEPTESETSEEPAEDEIEKLAAAKREELQGIVGDSIESLHRRLDSSRSDLTDSFTRLSTAHLEKNHEMSKQEHHLKFINDELQQQRLLNLPHAEFLAQAKLNRAKSEADEHLEDTLNLMSENLLEDERSFAFTSASIALLLIVAVPWILFAAFHCGSADRAAVAQLANDAFVCLMAGLRRLAM